MGPIFTFPCLVICDGTLDILDFALLNARYFCIPVNILALCSGTGLSYLEIVCSLWDLLLSFVGWSQISIWLGFVIPILTEKPFRVMPCELGFSSLWLWRSSAISSSTWALESVSSSPVECFPPPQASGSFSTWIKISSLVNNQGDSANLWSIIKGTLRQSLECPAYVVLSSGTLLSEP